MLNKVQIIGRLGRDVELRYTQSGSPVANFTVATDESYTDRSGNRVENTEWHRVVVFNKQAETCNQFIGKGSLVYVEGKLRTRKYTDREGQERQATEINADRVLFLDRRADRQGMPGDDGAQPSGPKGGEPRPIPQGGGKMPRYDGAQPSGPEGGEPRPLPQGGGAMPGAVDDPFGPDDDMPF